MSLAYEAARDAVLSLSDEVGLVERLARAHDVLATLDPVAHLPEHLRFRFEELVADIAYGADSVHAALARMSGADRHRLSERIVALFAEVARAFPGDL
ncbi:hypothetical protein [Lysobacter claricitrinus]|uniref:hypothetical protein n=1 Tax=Lysobacter claricitrinus TaxID=3367728 RepID=UPI0037DACB7F